MSTSTLASPAPAEEQDSPPPRGLTRPEPMVLAALGGVAAGALSLWHVVPDGLRLVLLLAFVLTAPGCASLVWWRGLSRVARAGVPPMLGLALIVLATSSEAFGKYWHPTGTVLVFGLASLISVAARVAAAARLPAEPSTSSESSTGDPRDDASARPAHRTKPGLATWVVPIILALALASWALCLPSVGTARVSAFGLLAAASPFYAVSIGLSGLAGVVALAQRNTLGLIGATASLIITERLTQSIATAVPLYPWTYKHLAVVDYVNRFHFVVRGTDIYHNWPGLFTTTAWLDQLTGVQAITIAHWFTPVYHVGLAAMVYAAARAWQRTPVVAAGSAFVFEACSFVQQDYFSPQALAYLLAIGTLLLLGESSRHRVAAVPAVIIFAALTITHQLTPYWLLIVAVLLVVARRLKPWWLPVVFALMAGGYLALNYSTVKKYAVVTSANPVQNIRLTHAALPVFGIRTQFYAIVFMYLILFGSAGIALLVRLIRHKEWLAPACLALSPILLLAVQGYGGEAIFRVCLYSLPGLSVVAASILFSAFARARLTAAIAALVGLVTVAASAHAFVGSYSAYRITASEVDVWHTFNRKAPIGAYIDAVSSGFPGNPEWYYATRHNNDASYSSALFGSSTTVTTNYSTNRSYQKLMTVLVDSTSDTNEPFYLVLSDAEQNYAQLYGVLPAGLTANLRRHMLHDPRWRLVRNAGSSQLFELRSTDSPVSS